MSRSFLKILDLHLSAVYINGSVWHAMLLKLLSPFSSYFIIDSCLFIHVFIIILNKLFHITIDLVLHHHCGQKVYVNFVVLVFGRIETVSIVLILSVILKSLSTISSHIHWCLVFSYHFKLFISVSCVNHIVEMLRFDFTFIFFDICPIIWIIHSIQVVLLDQFRIHFALLRILLCHRLESIGWVNPHLATIQSWVSEATAKC